jgi:hypothetical protein
MNASTVAANYYADTRARVAAALPEVGRLLDSIAGTEPHDLWLTQQGRAIEEARAMLRQFDSNGPAAAVDHAVAVMRPVQLGALQDAVLHALATQTGGSARVSDLDTATAAVLFAVGRRGIDPDTYRRAVAPLDQAGALVPHHPAELPDGTPLGHEWERGCAFRAGYSRATRGEPMDADLAEKMHPGNLDVVQAGYDAALVDQAP